MRKQNLEHIARRHQSHRLACPPGFQKLEKLLSDALARESAQLALVLDASRESFAIGCAGAIARMKPEEAQDAQVILLDTLGGRSDKPDSFS